MPIPGFARPWIGWVVGMDWPQGDEKALFRLADALVAALYEVVGGPDGDPSRSLLGRRPPDADEWDGDALQAFVKHVLTTTRGHQADAVNRLAAMALALNDLGVQLEYTKRMIKLTVVLLVVQIGAVILLLGTPLAGPTFKWIGFRALLSRAVIAQLAKRLLFCCGLFGTIMGVMDYAIQASQSRRDHVDVGQVLTSAGTGALSGALMGLGAGLLPTRSMLIFMAQSGVVGGITALVTEVWSAVGSGRPVDWKLVAEGLTSGFVGGIDRTGAGGGAHSGPGKTGAHLFPTDFPPDGTAGPAASSLDGVAAATKRLDEDGPATSKPAADPFLDGMRTAAHETDRVADGDMTTLARATTDRAADGARAVGGQAADVARAVPDEIRTSPHPADDGTQPAPPVRSDQVRPPVRAETAARAEAPARAEARAETPARGEAGTVSRPAAVPERGAGGEVTHERAGRADADPDPGGRPDARPERTGRPSGDPERPFTHARSTDRGDGPASHGDAPASHGDAPADRSGGTVSRGDGPADHTGGPVSRGDGSAGRTESTGSRGEGAGPRTPESGGGARADGPVTRMAESTGAHADGPVARAGETSSAMAERRPEPANRIEGLINWSTTRAEPPPSWHGMTQEQFAALAAKGTVGDPVVLSSGTESVKVERVTLTDGGPAARKETATTEMRDAEHLSSMLLRSLGLDVPPTHLVDEHTLITGWVEGERPELRWHGDRWELPEHVMHSRDAVLMGLGDALIGNYDRAHGDGMRVGDDGRLRGFDHDKTFRPMMPDPNSPLTRLFFREVEPGRFDWAPNPMSVRDMATLKAAVERLRPEFERLGRGDWFANVQFVLDKVAEHAGGADSVLKAPVDRPFFWAADEDLAARARAHRAVTDLSTDLSRPLVDPHEQLAARTGRGNVGDRFVNGDEGFAELVVHRDGSEALVLRDEAARRAEAEALLRDALGLDGPAVLRIDDDTVHQAHGSDRLRAAVQSGVRNSLVIDTMRGLEEVVEFNDGTFAIRREFDDIEAADRAELAALELGAVKDGTSGVYRADTTVMYEHRLGANQGELARRGLHTLLMADGPIPAELFQRMVADNPLLERISGDKGLWSQRDIDAVTTKLQELGPEFARRGLADLHERISDNWARLARPAQDAPVPLGSLDHGPRLVPDYSGTPWRPPDQPIPALPHLLEGTNLRQVNELAHGGDPLADAMLRQASAELALLPRQEGTVTVRVPEEWVPANLAPGAEFAFKGILEGVDDPRFLGDEPRTVRLTIRAGDYVAAEALSGRPHHALFRVDAPFKVLALQEFSHGERHYFLVQAPDGMGTAAFAEPVHRATPELSPAARHHYDHHRVETGAGIWLRDPAFSHDMGIERSALGVRSIDGAYYVDGHGGPDGLMVGGRTVRAEDLAAIILNDSFLQHDDLVILANCNVGAHTYAQEVARLTGHVVVAADSRVRVGPYGDMFAMDAEHGALGGRGNLRIFLPDDVVPPTAWERVKSAVRGFFGVDDSVTRSAEPYARTLEGVRAGIAGYERFAARVEAMVRDLPESSPFRRLAIEELVALHTYANGLDAPIDRAMGDPRLLPPYEEHVRGILGALDTLGEYQAPFTGQAHLSVVLSEADRAAYTQGAVVSDPRFTTAYREPREPVAVPGRVDFVITSRTAHDISVAAGDPAEGRLIFRPDTEFRVDRVDGDTVYVSEVARSGDGWVPCACAEGTHWGTNGAAGLLLLSKGGDGETYVLMQHRAATSDGGGTWSLLGGARDLNEGAVAAALREAAEESTLDPATVRIHGRHVNDHGGWSYETVIATLPEPVDIRPSSWESQGIRWVRLDELTTLDLHPGFAESWPDVQAEIHRAIDWDTAAPRDVSRTLYRHDELPAGDVDALLARFAEEGVSGELVRGNSRLPEEGVPVESVIRTASGDTLPPGTALRVIAVERDATMPDGRRGIRLYLTEGNAPARVPDLSHRVLSVDQQRFTAATRTESPVGVGFRVFGDLEDAAVTNRMAGARPVEGAVTVGIRSGYHAFRVGDVPVPVRDLATMLALDPRLVAEPGAAIVLRGPHAAHDKLLIQELADLTGRVVIAFEDPTRRWPTDGAAKIFLPEADQPAPAHPHQPVPAGDPPTLGGLGAEWPEGPAPVRPAPDLQTVREFARLRELSSTTYNLDFQGRTDTVEYARAVAERDWLEARLAERMRDRAEAAYIDQHAAILLETRALADELGMDVERLRAHLRDELVTMLADRPISMRVSPETLRAVLAEGRFKTQFEVASSGGVYDNVLRSAYEESWFGYPADLTPELRPVYGYVNLYERISDPSLIGMGTTNRVSEYGEVQVTLRPEVRDRSTFCVGDSIEVTETAVPSRINDPRPESYAAAPLCGFDPVKEPLRGVRRDYAGLDWQNNAYVEAQMHGGVRVSDISHVVFTVRPDAGLVAALEAAGIDWYYVYPGSTR
ncbi:DUF3626 domain-containing protein [Nonomuraea sp. NPDC004354]